MSCVLLLTRNFFMIVRICTLTVLSLMPRLNAMILLGRAWLSCSSTSRCFFVRFVILVPMSLFYSWNRFTSETTIARKIMIQRISSPASIASVFLLHVFYVKGLGNKRTEPWPRGPAARTSCHYTQRLVLFLIPHYLKRGKFMLDHVTNSHI